MKIKNIINERPKIPAGLSRTKNPTQIVKPVARDKDIKQATKKDVAWSGPKSNLWDGRRAQQAQNLESQGLSPEEIWFKTGTFRGADGEWKQEISDHGAKLKYIPSHETNFVKLSKVLDHPDLFKSYPHLKNMKIRWEDNSNDTGIQGWHRPSEGLIGMSLYDVDGSANSIDNYLDTLVHELQHAIQYKEKWQYGGNTRLGAKINPRDPYAGYLSTQGEIGARAAEGPRRILNKQQRAEQFPMFGTDTPTIYNPKTNQSEPSPYYGQQFDPITAKPGQVPYDQKDNPWPRTSPRPQLRPGSDRSTSPRPKLRPGSDNTPPAVATTVKQPSLSPNKNTSVPNNKPNTDSGIKKFNPVKLKTPNTQTNKPSGLPKQKRNTMPSWGELDLPKSYKPYDWDDK